MQIISTLATPLAAVIYGFGGCAGSALGTGDDNHCYPFIFWSGTGLGGSCYQVLSLGNGRLYSSGLCSSTGGSGKCSHTYAFSVRSAKDLIHMQLPILLTAKSCATPVQALALCNAQLEVAAVRAQQTATATRATFGQAQVPAPPQDMQTFGLAMEA